MLQLISIDSRHFTQPEHVRVSLELVLYLDGITVFLYDGLPTWPNSFRSEEFHVKSGMSYVSVVFLFIMTI